MKHNCSWHNQENTSMVSMRYSDLSVGASSYDPDELEVVKRVLPLRAGLQVVAGRGRRRRRGLRQRRLHLRAGSGGRDTEIIKHGEIFW